MKFYYFYDADGRPTHKYAKGADGKYIIYKVTPDGKETDELPSIMDDVEFEKAMAVSYKDGSYTDNLEDHERTIGKIGEQYRRPEVESFLKSKAAVNETGSAYGDRSNEYSLPYTPDPNAPDNNELLMPYNANENPTEEGFAPIPLAPKSEEYNFEAVPIAPKNDSAGFTTLPHITDPNKQATSGFFNPDDEIINTRPINKFNVKPTTLREDKQGAYDNWKSNGTNLVETRPITGFNVKPTIVDPKEYTPEITADDDSINDTDVVSTEDEDSEESKSTNKPEAANPSANVTTPELVKSTPWRDVKGSQYLQTREVPANSYRSFNFDGNEADHIAYNPLRGLSDAGRNVAQAVNNTFSSWGNKIRQSRAERQARQEQSDEKKDFMRGIAKDMVYNDGSFGKTYRPETVKEARELKREVRDVIREKERNERNAARDARKLDRIYKQTDRLMGRDYDAEQRAALEGFDKGAGLKNGQVLQDKISENIEGFNKVYSRKQEGGYIVAKDGIHINPANKGKFTASADRAGMGVQEFASHVLANKEDYSPTQVKRANFARAAAKWKYRNGGERTIKDQGSYPYRWDYKTYHLSPDKSNITSPNNDNLVTDNPDAVLYNTYSPEVEPQSKSFTPSFGKRIITPQENPFGLSQNPLGYKFDGNDKFSKYRLKDASIIDPNKAYGQDMTKVNSANPFKVSSPTKFSSQYDGLATDAEPEPVVEVKKEPIIPGANYDPTRLHIYGNIMQHQANMLPVMYNTAKSLFDKPEVQNPIYNKQDVAVAQGMRRNMIAPNMNPIVDNRAAMQQAIRGNARGSGQLMNSMQANYNNAAKMMNEEQYRTKNANIAQMNNYLQKLGEIGDNRRQIDTLVDEKNRQHRLAFDKFQRDALESGEKALINKGQLHNQELADEISMQNYLNQIAKYYEYVKGPNGMPYVKFKDKKTGETKVMSAKMMKDNISRMYTDLDNNNAADAAANNAQAAETNRRIAELEATNRELLKGTPDHEVLKDHAQKNTELRNQNAALLREIEALKAAQNPSGKKKAGGFVYKRKMF